MSGKSGSEGAFLREGNVRIATRKLAKSVTLFEFL